MEQTMNDQMTGAEAAMGTVSLIVYLAIMILMLVGLWKVFVKAGQPGWGCLIPIYNILVMLRVAGRPWWWLLLMLIPIVNIVILIMINIDIARNFGKGIGFAIGMILLGFVFIPLLGFGDAEYNPVEH